MSNFKPPKHFVRPGLVIPLNDRGNIELSRERFEELLDSPVFSQPSEVSAPSHYTWLSGIECKDVTGHFPFHVGAAIKYLWRAGRKGDRLTDLLKARKSIDNEIALERSQTAEASE